MTGKRHTTAKAYSKPQSGGVSNALTLWQEDHCLVNDGLPFWNVNKPGGLGYLSNPNQGY